jgi:hypothetical protein
MKNFVMIAVAASFARGGCAQVGKAADGVWSGTKSVAKFVSSPFRGKEDLRDAPAQDYAFGQAEQGDYVVELYDAPKSYAGYDVVLYDSAPKLRQTAASYTVVSDPRDVAFVKLNGTSETSDWRSCEMLHRGYLFATERELRLSPEFEVCMRNKGYVLSAEAGPYAANPLTAQSARSYPGYTQPRISSYSYP